MNSDPFAMLGLPRRFDLDRASIERAYLAKVGQDHPDAGGGGAGDLNQARAMVSDPESRANVLLGLLGGPTKEEDRSLPPGFLMEMMESRERLESARGSGDEAEMARWTAWAEGQRVGHIAAVKALFAEVEGAGGAGEAKRKAIRMRLNAWRYIERMLEQVDGAM